MDRELLARRLSQPPEPDTPVDSAQQPAPAPSTGDGTPLPGPTSRENVPWDRPGPEAWPASDLQQLTLDGAPLPERQEGDQADEPAAEAPPWDRPAEEFEPPESTLTTGPAWDRPDDYSWPTEDSRPTDDNWQANDGRPTEDSRPAADATAGEATQDEMPELESVLARISESEQLAFDPDDAMAPVVADLGEPTQPAWPEWSEYAPAMQHEPVADKTPVPISAGDAFDFQPASQIAQPLEPQVASPPSEAEPAPSRPIATNTPVNLVVRIELAVDGNRLVPVEVTLRSPSHETVESSSTPNALDVEPAYVLDAPPDQEPPPDFEDALDLEPARDLEPIYLPAGPPSMEPPPEVEPPPDPEPTRDSASTSAVELPAGFAPVSDPLADLPAPPAVAEPPAATYSTGSPDQAPDAFVALPAEPPDPWRAPEPYAHAHSSAEEDGAAVAEKPSSLMTVGVTIGFGILVVALLFVFAQLLTSLLA